jgi:hypothetical protein
VTLYSNEGKVLKTYKTKNRIWTNYGTYYFQMDDGSEVRISGNVAIEEVK